jgi:hypothetical protein
VICRGIDEHVPFEDRLAPATEIALGLSELRTKLGRLISVGEKRRTRERWPSPLASIPKTEQFAALCRLARAQDPRHSPEHEQTPPFADEWMAAYDRGRDVVDWYRSDPDPNRSGQGA